MRNKAALTAAIRADSRVALVVNVTSRRARKVAASLAPRLRAAGVTLIADLAVTRPDEFEHTLDKALDAEPDLLVFGGGDGSMAAAATYLGHRDVALGVLPLGTTNNYARSLGLPLDLDGAIETIGNGKVADVDLGHVRSEEGERLFANHICIGLSVEVMSGVSPRLKHVLGRPAYMLTAVRMLPRHQPFHAVITTADGVHDFWTHQLNVANGRFHAGRAIAKDASIDDSLLVVFRLGDQPRAGLSVAMIGQLVHGARRRLATSRYLTATEVRVETVPSRPIEIDGEIGDHTPITVAAIRNALRVMVPQEFEDS